MFYIALFAICFLITIWVCDYLFSLNWSSLTVCTAHGVGTRCQILPELWNIEYLLKLLVLSILMSTSLVRISPTSTPYSHDLKTGHSKSGSIRKPNKTVQFSNGQPFHGSIFKCHLKTGQNDHSKTGPFHIRSTFDHSKTGHVRFSNPRFTVIIFVSGHVRDTNDRLVSLLSL